MPEYLKKNWVQLSVTFVVSILGCLLAFTLTSNLQAKTSLEKELSKKANLQYVIDQDNANKQYTDKMIDNLKEKLDQHIQEDIESRKTYFKLLESVDGNVKALINKK